MISSQKFGLADKETGMKQFLKKYGTVLVLILFLLFNTIFTDNFFTASSALNILQQASISALLAVGMTVVAAVGCYDLGIGSYAALVGVISALMFKSGISLIPVLIVCMLVIMFIELIAGWMTAYLELQSIIVTIGLQILVKGIATVITGGTVIQIDYEPFLYIGQGRPFGVPFQVVLSILVIAVFAFIMSRSSFARRLAATGDNEKAARLCGINTRKVKVVAFMLCGFLATVAAFIATAKIEGADPANIGADYGLNAIAATAIGGTPLTGGKPHIIGTIIGVLIIQLVDTSINMNNIEYSYSLVIKAAIILLALIFQNEKKD